MALEYFIVGGYIKIPKDIFVKEMLSRDSVLRPLLKSRSTAGFIGKHPMVSEPDEDNVITINFGSNSNISIGDDPKKFMDRLKVKYREKIKGWVACLCTYEMFNGLYTVKIDLNSDGDEVEYL